MRNACVSFFSSNNLGSCETVKINATLKLAEIVDSFHCDVIKLQNLNYKTYKAGYLTCFVDRCDFLSKIDTTFPTRVTEFWILLMLTSA